METKNNYKELFNNTLIFAIASLLSRVISFFLVPLYTNILSTSEYGIVEVILDLTSILIPIASLSLSEAVLRYGLDKNVNKQSVLKNCILVLFVSSIILALTTPLFGLYKNIGGYCVYLGAICVSQMFRSCLSIFLKSVDKTKLFAINSIIYSINLALFNILFLVILKIGINGYFLAYLCTEIISILFICIFGKIFVDFRKGHYDALLLKNMIKYSAPLVVSSLAWWIMTFSDRFMIQLFIDNSAVGIYSVSTRIPGLLSALMSIFIQAWNLSSIKVYDSNNNLESFFSNTFKYYMPIMVIGASFILLVLKPFMAIYVGKDYLSSIDLIPFLLVSTCFLMISWFFNPIYNAYKKNVASSITVLLAAMCNILANFFLINTLGVMGAVIGTLISNIILAIIRIIDTRRFFKFEIGVIKVISSFLVLFAQSISFLFNWNIYVMSTICLAVLVIIHFKNLKEILLMLYKLLKETKGRYKNGANHN